MATCAGWYGKEKTEEQGDLKIRDPRGLRTGLGCYFTGSSYFGQRGSHKVRQLSSLQWMACVCWSERISMGLNNQGCFTHSPHWVHRTVCSQLTFNELTVFSLSCDCSINILLPQQVKSIQSISTQINMEKEMATRSSILAWRIAWTEELQSTGSQRVGHNWATSLSLSLSTLSWEDFQL